MKLFKTLIYCLLLSIAVPTTAAPMLMSISPNTSDIYLPTCVPHPSSCQARTFNFEKSAFHPPVVPTTEAPSISEWINDHHKRLFWGAIGFLYLSLVGVSTLKILRKA